MSAKIFYSGKSIYLDVDDHLFTNSDKLPIKLLEAAILACLVKDSQLPENIYLEVIISNNLIKVYTDPKNFRSINDIANKCWLLSNLNIEWRLIMKDPKEKEIRGTAVDSSKIVDQEGKDHKVFIPEDMLGKNVVIRGNKVTERIDS